MQRRSGFLFFTLIIMTSFYSSLALSFQITMGGDFALNPHRRRVSPNGVLWGRGSIVPWEQLSQGVAPLFTGDLNFLNLETVITDTNILSAQNKAYVFRGHPNGVAHYADLGVNLISAANNHGWDYGAEGAIQTFEHLSQLANAQFPQGFHFSGLGKEPWLPHEFEKDGVTIAFSSVVSIGSTWRAQKKSAENDPDNGADFQWVNTHWAKTIESLKKNPAQFKILSVHYGIEKVITVTQKERERFRSAIREAGIDLIIAHHPHVVRPIEFYEGSLIFYSLGNFQILGAANINRRGEDRDFGLFAKLDYDKTPGGGLRPKMIEFFPLKNMHFKTEVREGTDKDKRVQVINQLNRQHFSANALLFNVESARYYFP